MVKKPVREGKQRDRRQQSQCDAQDRVRLATQTAFDVLNEQGAGFAKLIEDDFAACRPRWLWGFRRRRLNRRRSGFIRGGRRFRHKLLRSRGRLNRRRRKRRCFRQIDRIDNRFRFFLFRDDTDSAGGKLYKIFVLSSVC